MKNKLYLIFALFISVLMINTVNAESIITYDKTYEYGNQIDYFENMITINNKLYILTTTIEGTIIVSPNTDFSSIQVEKTFELLTNPSIIKYNNNILLLGIENNTLKTYLLNENLQITDQKTSSYIIDQDAKIKAYNYDNKIYLMLFENDTMQSSNIYEITQDLTITEKTLSSYDSELLKKVLKGDYYIIRMNDTENQNRITHYKDTTYNKDYSVLVGYTSNITYNDETGYDYKAHLTILDSNGEEIINTEVPEYMEFVDVEFIKGKIIILTLKTYDDSSLLVYDTTGKLEEEIAIEDYYNEKSMKANKLIKLNNQLVVHSKQEVKWQYRYQTFAFYNYDLSIYTLENLYGTLEVAQNAKAGDVVELKIVPNSGYEVSEITIIDNLGNQILVSENKFTMPDEDVYIIVNYKAIVNNPETADLIIIIGIIAILIYCYMYFVKRRMEWLK